jgi:hypothetical protein
MTAVKVLLLPTFPVTGPQAGDDNQHENRSARTSRGEGMSRIDERYKRKVL